MLRFSAFVVAKWREVSPLRLVAEALAPLVRARQDIYKSDLDIAASTFVCHI